MPVAYTWNATQAKIPDETASKPEDWDEDAPQQIEDAAASKPSGWLDDGELVRPVALWPTALQQTQSLISSAQ